jgi:hypothetical protein
MTPKPVLPTTSPAISSPRIAEIRKRGSDASSGPGETYGGQHSPRYMSGGATITHRGAAAAGPLPVHRARGLTPSLRVKRSVVAEQNKRILDAF